MRVVKVVNIVQDGVRSKMCTLHHPHAMTGCARRQPKGASLNDTAKSVIRRALQIARGHASPTHVRKDVRMTSAHAVGPLRALGVRKWCRPIAPFPFFLTCSRF